MKQPCYTNNWQRILDLVGVGLWLFLRSWPCPPKKLESYLWTGRQQCSFLSKKQPAPASLVNSMVLYIILYGLYMKMNILQFAQCYFTERISEHLQHRAPEQQLHFGLFNCSRILTASQFSSMVITNVSLL